MYKFGLNIFAAPSAHSPGSVRCRGDPWLPSDCCTRSLSDRGPAVWKSSCRTCRILQRPVSPGSRLCLRPTDNVEKKKKHFRSKKIGRALPLSEIGDSHPPGKICPTTLRTYLRRHQTCWSLLTLIIAMARQWASDLNQAICSAVSCQSAGCTSSSHWV